MKAILSTILSLVILITTSGFTISKHICGGAVVETALSFTTADISCGMESLTKNCESTSIQENCCQNEIIKIQIEEEYVQQLTNVVNTPFFVSFISTYFNLQPNNVANNNSFIDYSPPLPDKDIPVLFQTLLI